MRWLRNSAFFAVAFFTTPALACVSDYVDGGGTSSPTITIVNRCSYPIWWSMCINVTSRVARDFPSGQTASGGVSRSGLWLQTGDRVNYRYSWCPYVSGNNCRPRQPSC